MIRTRTIHAATAFKATSVLALVLLAACGGGSGSTDTPTLASSSTGGDTGVATTAGSAASGTGTASAPAGAASTPMSPASPVAGTAVPVAAFPATDSDAARLLQQATMGYTASDIARVRSIGYSAWIDEQFAMAQQYSFLSSVNRGNETNPDVRTYRNTDMFGHIALIRSNDQLRQRHMWSLSQIFVVSMKDDSTYYWGRSFAKYIDNLYAHGFGTYRNLLETVTLSPAMGAYLTYLYNMKEDAASGRVPDQNFAREVMQLFSIGLWELNLDGTQKLDANGKPISTYGPSDIVGVSRVMTGWAPRGATSSHWSHYYCFCQNAADIPAQSEPLVGYPAYHSTSEKKFLGVTIPAGATTPAADLKVLLDRLANHPNVGPFIGKQLIQRMVTSNPSPAYVERVARVFNDNGSGVRGDLKAVLKAILLDNEARSATVAAEPTFGRITEPVLRFTRVSRALKAAPGPNPYSFEIPRWSYDARKGLWQTPFDSPTVFNFYQPGYSPLGTEAGNRGLLAPEMQITHSTSGSDIHNFMGGLAYDGGYTNSYDDRKLYMKLDYSELLPLVATPDALFDKLEKLFMTQPFSATLRSAMKAAMDEKYQSNSHYTGLPYTNAQIKLGAALLVMVSSPEFIVQK